MNYIKNAASILKKIIQKYPVNWLIALLTRPRGFPKVTKVISEGYQGRVRAKPLYDVECEAKAPCYFVVAHDGDNSSGRAGSEETWNNSSDVTYSDSRVEALGVDEYLTQYPVSKDDYIHIQDGSWIDTRDSSADPSWYHWHLPFGVWEAQRYSFNEALKTNLETYN